MIVNNTVAPPYAAGMRYPRPTRRECAIPALRGGNALSPPYAAGMRYPRPTRRECAPMSRRVGRGYQIFRSTVKVEIF